MVDSPTAKLAGIPDEARAAFERLLARPLANPAALAQQVAGYIDTLRAAARHNELLDLPLGETIARHCQILLDRWPQATEPQRHAIQAAVEYFFLQEDADDDLEDILGLEDDAQVVSAVLEHLGLAPMPLP